MSGVADGFDDCVHVFVCQNDLDFDLGKKVDDIFSAPVKLRMTLLAPEAFGFRDSDALQADVLKGFLHFVEFERLDDRFDLFHEKIALRFSR